MYYPFSGWPSNSDLLPAYPYDGIPYSHPITHPTQQRTNLLPPSTISEVPDPNLKIRLDNEEIWDKFSEYGTEMIVTRSGRRMFPSLRIRIEGMKPDTSYMILLDLVQADSYRYRYYNSKWSVNGAAEPIMTGQRVIVHSDSPASGSYWMSKSISFHTAKITNNTSDKCGNIVLNSMQKYLPRIHIVEATNINQLRTSFRNTFTFKKTSFIAVTAYQNKMITKLKIDNNPFAKGFRETSKRVISMNPSNDDSDEESIASPISGQDETKNENIVTNSNSNNKNNKNMMNNSNINNIESKTQEFNSFLDSTRPSAYTSTPISNKFHRDPTFNPFASFESAFSTTSTPQQSRSFNDSGYSSGNPSLLDPSLLNPSLLDPVIIPPDQDFQIEQNYNPYLMNSSYMPTSDYMSYPGDSYSNSTPTFVRRHLDKRRRRQHPYQPNHQNLYNP